MAWGISSFAELRETVSRVREPVYFRVSEFLGDSVVAARTPPDSIPAVDAVDHGGTDDYESSASAAQR